MAESFISPNGALVGYNPITSYVHHSSLPTITDEVLIGPNSIVFGDVIIEGPVSIGFNNVIRADYGSPFYTFRLRTANGRFTSLRM